MENAGGVRGAFSTVSGRSVELAPNEASDEKASEVDFVNVVVDGPKRNVLMSECLRDEDDLASPLDRSLLADTTHVERLFVLRFR